MACINSNTWGLNCKDSEVGSLWGWGWHLLKFHHLDDWHGLEGPGRLRLLCPEPHKPFQRCLTPSLHGGLPVARLLTGSCRLPSQVSHGAKQNPHHLPWPNLTSHTDLKGENIHPHLPVGGVWKDLWTRFKSSTIYSLLKNCFHYMDIQNAFISSQDTLKGSAFMVELQISLGTVLNLSSFNLKTCELKGQIVLQRQYIVLTQGWDTRVETPFPWGGHGGNGRHSPSEFISKYS